MLEQILQSLNFDQDEIKTYLLLLELGPVTAGQLAKKMGTPRSSLYGFLKRLEGRGLVIESQHHGIKTFTAENPEKINLLFSQNIEALQKNQIDFSTLLPTLKRGGEKLINPKFQIFEGKEQLQSALKDMLLYYDLTTVAFWPQKKMVEMLEGSFFRYHNKERIKNRLSVRAIWPQSQVVDVQKHPYFGTGPKFKREIRIAPTKVQASMGYWIYGNKTVFISSQKESFGFILESSEFSLMLQAQFEVLWEQSTPLHALPPESETFIEQLGTYNF